MSEASRTQPPTFSTACPVCRTHLELFSRRDGHVTVGCDACAVRLTVPEATWLVALMAPDAPSRMVSDDGDAALS